MDEEEVSKSRLEELEGMAPDDLCSVSTDCGGDPGGVVEPAMNEQGNELLAHHTA